MKGVLEKVRTRLLPRIRWGMLPLVLVCAAAVDGYYLFQVIGPLGPDHSQELSAFSPSVMFAAGRGMVCPAEMDMPALSEFLRMKTMTFDPADVPDTFEVWDLSPFCQTHYYLMLAVGSVWRCFGISWQTVKLVPLALFVAAAGFMYGLFRLGMGRLLAAVFSLAVMCSPPMLAMTVSIRDFSKAPFILGAIFLSVLLAAKPLSRRALPGVAAALGLLLGVGLGFRQDAMIALPPALAAAVLARGAVPLRWWMRAVAPAALLAGFFLAGTPILRAIGVDEGAVSSHTLFQGLSQEAETNLDFSGASFYLLPSSRDNLVHSVINVHARRSGDTDPMENYLSPAYGRAGRRMFLEVARTLPAELTGRAYAAVLAVFRVPDEFPKQMAYARGMDNDWARALVRLHQPVAGHLAKWGLAYAILALACLGACDLRAALAAAAALLYFGGYTSLLFQYRHAFHLAFMPWWAAAFLLALAVRGMAALPRLIRARRAGEPVPLRRAAWGAARGSAVVAALLLALAVPLAAARLWQHAGVDGMVRACAGASLEPIDMQREASGERVMLSPVQRPWGLVGSEAKPPMEASWDYLAVEVDTGGALVPITLEYDKSVFGSDFTQTINVEPPPDATDGVVRYFFPVYEVSAIPPPEGKLTIHTGPIPWHRGKFLGISVARQDADRIKSVCRVADTTALSFLPYLWLPKDTVAFRGHNVTTVEGLLAGWWADAAAVAGNPDHALDRYRSMLRWHPSEQALYDGVDRLFSRHADRWDRTAQWERLAAAHADQPYARTKYAVALTDAGRYADARAVLQAVMDKSGLRAYACAAFLDTMIRGGDINGAANYVDWCRQNGAPLPRAAERAVERAKRERGGGGER